MTPALHPEIQRLTELNTALRTELADLLTEAHDLTNIVRPNLLAIYQMKLGAWELEKLKAQLGVARLKRTIVLAQSALNRGGKPDMEQIEAQVKEEQVLWEVKLKETAAKLQHAERRLAHLLCVCSGCGAARPSLHRCPLRYRTAHEPSVVFAQRSHFPTRDHADPPALPGITGIVSSRPSRFGLHGFFLSTPSDGFPSAMTKPGSPGCHPDHWFREIKTSALVIGIAEMPSVW